MRSSDGILTLADLASWSFSGTALAVLGFPIKHSVSPAMHNAALAELAMSDDRFSTWQYFKFEIQPDNLALALPLFYQKGFRGLNLTVPHKVIALPLVASVDRIARMAGAANTLLHSVDGYSGYNTDGPGLAAAIKQDLGIDPASRDIVLLGAGGAARGAAVEFLERRCRSLWIANRTEENLVSLLSHLKPLAGNTMLRGFSPTAVPSDFPSDALVVNATSSGLRPGDSAPIELTQLPRPAAIYDMIYNPCVTPLLMKAAALGIPHANGLSMLVYQGAYALERWTGRPSPVEIMHRAAVNSLK